MVFALVVILTVPDLNAAYQWEINTCNAPNVGYSQTYRNAQKVNGVTYYDCSSFQWFGLIAGGWNLTGWPFTTSNMGPVLESLGFSSLSTTGEWKPGDIVWRPGHTEMVYQGGNAQGICMGAHTSNAKLENQVSIGSSSGNPTAISTPANYTKLYRYGDGGATGVSYSDYVIAAICGNWWQESGLNPGIWEGLVVGAPGYGLGQWTDNATTSRRTALFEYLDSHGFPRDSGDGQIQFFTHENYWTPVSGVPYASLGDFLASEDTNLTTLTYAFKRCWEGNNDDTLSIRVEAAQKCFNFIQSHQDDPSITTWYSGNYYLTENQRLNNAVMIYRFLSVGGSGGGGGGIPSNPKKNMPVWMMIRYK